MAIRRRGARESDPPARGGRGIGHLFYLDDQDRAVIPTTTRHVLVVAVRGDAFAQEADYDLTGAVGLTDQVISALPDFDGRIWFASKAGVVGTVDPASAALRSLDLREGIGNSFAVAPDGVYVVTDGALYRLAADADGTPRVVWRTPYANTGATKSGQTQQLRLLEPDRDRERPHDEPRPAARRRAGRPLPDGVALARERPQRGAQALAGRGPRLHLHQAARDDGKDAWYLTALDARTGETAFQRLGGEGLGFNNNYAPITIGPDGTAYLGVLGGIVAWRDRQAPPAPTGSARRAPRLRLRRHCRHRALCV